VLNGNIVSFNFPNGYDKNKELIIDPTLMFSTYSGSFSNNFGYTATFDRDGFLYSGSTAFGTQYPTTVGAYDVSFNGGIVDIAISKYDTTGTFMVYSTYVGGNSDELPHSMIVNSNDEIFVYGTTSSTNWPYTTGCYDSTFAGGTATDLQNGLGVNFINGSDIVVFRLSALGDALLASTLIGGTANDGLNYTPTIDVRYNYADEVRGEIEIDKQDNIYVVSCTRSGDFPVTPGSFQQVYGGGELDGCVFKMDNKLTTLIWSSYLGGSANDAVYSLALDKADNPYVTGGTVSTNFPSTTGVLYPTNQGGRSDGFITQFDKNGSSILRSTFFGSDSYDQAYFIETDREDSVYIFGQTEKTGPYFIINAAYSTLNSGQFVTKITPELDSIVWSTVFGSGGGAPNISPTAFLVDVCNKIYLSGWGGSTNGFATVNNAITTNGMDITAGAYQSTTDGSDFYLMVLEADASNIFYGSYFGGAVSTEHVDGGTSRFDRNGRMYQSVCAGCGGNSDFPIEPNPGAVSAVNNNSCNNGVFKFDFNLPITLSDFDATPIVCLPDTTYFINRSLRGTAFTWNFGDGNISNLINPKHVYASPGTYTVTLVVSDTSTCNLADSIQKQVTILADSNWSLGTDSICQGSFAQIGILPLPVSGITYNWQPSTGLSDTTIANPIASPSVTTNYVLLISNGTCTDTVYQTVNVTTVDLIKPNDTVVCDGTTSIQLTASSNGTGAFIQWSSSASYSDTLNTLGDSSLTIVPGVATTYYIKAVNNGCEITDTVFVDVFGSQIQLTAPVGICLDDTTTISVTNNSSDPLTYDWEPNSEIIMGDNSPIITVSPNATTWFYVTASNVAGCTITDSIRLYVSPLPVLGVTATTDLDTIVEGSSVNIHASPTGYSYAWSPVGTLDNPFAQHPTASPTVTTTYGLTVSDTGCVLTDSVKIYVRDVICGKPDIYVPNAFTPDVDGNNDKVFVRGNNLSEMKLSIFHRWGEKVFETTNQTKGWDGTFKGRECDPAVFVYYLEVTCIGNDTYFEKGNITLIR
jgi:gliding motility-associated-like protein